MLREKLTELMRHSAVYALAWFASSAASILLLPVYTRYLTKTDYGVLELLDHTNGILRLVLSVGAASAIAKFYSAAGADRDRGAVISTAINSYALMLLAATGILLTQSGTISRLVFGSPAYSRYVALNLIVLFLDILYAVNLTHFAVAKRSGVFVTYNLVRLVFAVGANVYYIVVQRLGALGMIYGNLTALTVFTTVITCHNLWLVGWRVEPSLFRKMLRFGAPMVPATVAMIVMHNSDRFLVRYYCSVADVGLYSLGYKFPFMLGVLLLQSFNMIWSSATMYELGVQERAAHQFGRIATYFLFAFVSSQFVLSVLARQVIGVMAASQFHAASAVVAPVALGMCFYAFYTFSTAGAFLRDKTHLLNYSYVPAALFNLAANAVFLPRFGYIAAAWVTTATYALFAVLTYVTCRKALRIHFEAKRLTVLFILVVSVYGLSSLHEFGNQAVELLKELFVLCAFFALLFRFGGVTEEEKAVLGQGVHRIVQRVWREPCATSWLGRKRAAVSKREET